MKELIKKKVGLPIRIYLKNGFKFEGKIQEVHNNYFVLHDIIDGSIVIDYESVSIIKEGIL
jgi:sRNA-binding regulator protein Hfq